MHEIVREKLSEIQALCRSLPIRRLEVFGSAARGTDFNLATSDVDVLVEFDFPEEFDPSIDYFGIRLSLQDGLEEILCRSVDVLQERTLKNPYIQRSVMSSKEQLYAA